jgi:hypothetical protein
MVKRLLLCVSLVLLTTACAENTKVAVTRFNQQPMGFAGRSFSVYADATQSGSLEFQNYAGQVGAALVAHGLTAAPANGASDVVVQVHFASKDPHAMVYSEYDPYWDWGWHRRGPWSHAPYGAVGSVTMYTQMLEVDILDGATYRQGKPQMLYQGRAFTESQASDINTSFPALVTGLFGNFPGPSGVTETVEVPAVR